MSVKGYIRVSTEKQTNEHWKLMISDHASSNSLDAPEWIEETVSGKKPWRERKLSQIIKTAQKGDILIVGEASRIGRDASDALDFIKEAKRANITVHIVQAGLIVDGSDESADASLIILPVLFGIAEYERKLLSYRTKLGLKKAREAGKQLGGYRVKGEDVGGRREHPEKRRIIQSYKAGGTIAGTARAYNISRMTLYRWIQETA